MVLLEEPLSHPHRLYLQRNCARSYPMYLYEVIVPEKKRGLIILVTLFLLHQIIPGFSILDELALISQFKFL